MKRLGDVHAYVLYFRIQTLYSSPQGTHMKNQYIQQRLRSIFKGAHISIRGLGLGLQDLYSVTNCADNILGRFTIILQNQIARVDSFTNLTKRCVFKFRLNVSISSHNLISFGKQFRARGPYTANARLPKTSY